MKKKVDTLFDKISNIRNELKTYFLERDEEVDCLLTALLSKNHALLLGAPGTSKSYLTRCLTLHIQGANYFEILLTKFTTPEEIFGAFDIQELKNGRYVRKIDGKLPTAHIGFVDEIFKASSSILNSLLTIINERIFHNDKPIQTPLTSLFTASNELPEDSELNALYDRLLIRKTVEYIKLNKNLVKLLMLSEYSPKTKITLSELQEILKAVEKVDVSNIIDPLLNIRSKLKEEGIQVSDRRLRSSISVIKAYAFLNSKTVATEDDLEILQYVFWEDPEQINKVSEITLKVSNPYTRKASQLMGVIEDLRKDIEALSKTGEVTQELMKKYSEIVKVYKELNKKIDEAKKLNKNVEPLLKVKSATAELKEFVEKEVLGIEV
jgi:MoxR-like ATPase